MTPTGTGLGRCNAVVDHLADLVDGCGPAELRAHLATCPRCGALVRDSVAVRQALGAVPAVPLPRGFEHELLARLQRVAAARQAPPARAPFRFAFAGLALATAALLLVVGGFWLSRRPLPALDMGLTQLVSVEVEVQAAAAAEDVRVEVTLPNGLEVASEDAELAPLHRLAWTTNLAPGSNRFTLVLRAAALGEQSLQIALASGAQRASAELRVRVHGASEQAGLLKAGRVLSASRVRLRLDARGQS